MPFLRKCPADKERGWWISLTIYCAVIQLVLYFSVILLWFVEFAARAVALFKAGIEEEQLETRPEKMQGRSGW